MKRRSAVRAAEWSKYGRSAGRSRKVVAGDGGCLGKNTAEMDDGRWRTEA